MKQVFKTAQNGRFDVRQWHFNYNFAMCSLQNRHLSRHKRAASANQNGSFEAAKGGFSGCKRAHFAYPINITTLANEYKPLCVNSLRKTWNFGIFPVRTRFKPASGILTALNECDMQERTAVLHIADYDKRQSQRHLPTHGTDKDKNTEKRPVACFYRKKALYSQCKRHLNTLKGT